MKPYRDVFGNKLTKKDVSASALALNKNKAVTAHTLHRLTGLGISKCNRIHKLLQDADVIGLNHLVILTGPQAENAALRQLKKGRG